MREREGAVGLKKLCVGFDTHLTYEITCMWSEESITFELSLCPNCESERGREREEEIV